MDGTLWLTDQNDNVTERDLLKLCSMTRDQLIKDQDSDDRKTVVDLLGKLLEPGPSDRHKHFSRGEAATFVLAVADGAACI